MRFDELSLSDDILDALDAMRFDDDDDDGLEG